MKVCSKCKQELPATTEYFHRDKSRKGGLFPSCKKCVNKRQKEYSRKHKKQRKGYRQKHKEQIKKYNREYYQRYKEWFKKYNQGYRKTIEGYLRTVYTNINLRCGNPNCKGYKNYGGRGIRNKFSSSDGFVDYIINTLGYDTYDKIKGLQIDRIDNDGHYDKGNIRFVTPKVNCGNRG